jgi:hypothetical protein
MSAAALDSPDRRAAEPPAVEAHSASQQIQHASQAGGSAGTEARPAGTLARSCKRCGGAIPAQEPGKPGAKPQYCSIECQVEARNQRKRATGEPAPMPEGAAAVRPLLK